MTEPGTVTLHRAAFPIWRVVDAAGREVPIHGPLLSFEAEPGQYRVERVTIWQERIGAWMSCLAALVLVVVAAGVPFRKPKLLIRRVGHSQSGA